MTDDLLCSYSYHMISDEGIGGIAWGLIADKTDSFKFGRLLFRGGPAYKLWFFHWRSAVSSWNSSFCASWLSLVRWPFWTRDASPDHTHWYCYIHWICGDCMHRNDSLKFSILLNHSSVLIHLHGESMIFAACFANSYCLVLPWYCLGSSSSDMVGRGPFFCKQYSIKYRLNGFLNQLYAHNVTLLFWNQSHASCTGACGLCSMNVRHCCMYQSRSFILLLIAYTQQIVAVGGYRTFHGLGDQELCRELKGLLKRDLILPSPNTRTDWRCARV